MSTLSASTRASRRLGLAAAATALGLVLAASTAVGPASAHDELVSSTPAAGDALDPAPSEISLTYSDNILEVGIEVSVTDAAGTQYVAEEPVVDGPTVTVALESDMPGGSYQAEWRVVSSDGHPISGTIPFSVTTPVPTEEATTSATPDASEPPMIATPTDEASDSPAVPADEASTNEPTGGQIALVAAIALAALVVVAAVIIIIARRRGPASGTPTDGSTRDEL